MLDDEYTLVEDVVAPAGRPAGNHLVDYQTQEMVSTLWSKYLAQLREGLPSTPLPVMRRVSYSLDSEAFEGQELRRGIKVLGRTRRSCTFGAALWSPETGQKVHDAEIIMVFVEPGVGSVPIPDDFWAAVEQSEGRAIPVTERS